MRASDETLVEFIVLTCIQAMRGVVASRVRAEA